MTLEFATFARHDGMAVAIELYGVGFCIVRYIGAKGRRITTDSFPVATPLLEEF